MNFHGNRDDEEDGNWDSNDGRSWEAITPPRTFCRCVSNRVQVEEDKVKHGDRSFDVAEDLQLVRNE